MCLRCAVAESKDTILGMWRHLANAKKNIVLMMVRLLAYFNACITSYFWNDVLVQSILEHIDWLFFFNMLGRLFHSLITRLLKKCFPMSSLDSGAVWPCERQAWPLFWFAMERQVCDSMPVRNHIYSNYLQLISSAIFSDLSSIISKRVAGSNYQ